LNVATDMFEPYVVLIAIVILVGLFLMQSHGTAGIGKLFGPVMIVWFLTIAVLGVGGLLTDLRILTSINPWYGWRFFLDNGWQGFLVLGSVFLVVTGGEALYADMGHFGRAPIRLAWFALAMPSLLLNYLGQGAILIHRPDAAKNPFYQLAPGWALYPLVALATVAAVIASQALISGAFSTTMQAMHLGFLPRLLIRHTSKTHYGQIYMPTVNWILMIGCILTVLGFRTSSGLAAAYGIAVTSTMAITSIIFFTVARERWQWSLLHTGLITAGFLVVDLAFLGANIVKIPDGGWFPILFAIVMFTIMTTWKRGREILGRRMMERIYPLQQFFEEIEQSSPIRVPGTAIFMSGSGDGVPPALLQNLEHNRVLHERVVLMTIKTQPKAHVPAAERTEYQPLKHGFGRLIINYGFMDEPDVPEALTGEAERALGLEPTAVSYFLGRETLLASIRSGGMALWRERLFAAMSRNATSPTAYFQLPPQRVVELGSHVEI
jgi:KUP system potassium uptake protein